MLYNERMLLSKHNTSQMSHGVDERDLLAGFIVINIIRLRCAFRDGSLFALA